MDLTPNRYPRSVLVATMAAAAAVLWIATAACQTYNNASIGTIHLTVTAQGAGAVTSRPGLVFCKSTADNTLSGNCSDTFNTIVSSVHLTASPAPGWQFDHWVQSSATGPINYTDSEVTFANNQGSTTQQWSATFVPIVGYDAGTDAGPVVDAGPTIDAGQILMTAADSGTTLDFKHVVYFQAGTLPDGGARPGQFVLSAPGGKILLSTDGQGFVSTQTNDPDAGLSPILIAGPNAVLCVDGKDVFSSVDGLTWTYAGVADVVANATAGAYGANVYAVAGVNSAGVLIETSPDGVTWTSQITGPASHVLNSLIWTGSQFVVIGNGATLSRSPDGISWTDVSIWQQTLRDLESVAAKGTTIVSEGGAAGQIDTIVSNNGGTSFTKTAAAFPSTVSINAMTYASPLFIAVGSGGLHFTSTDGTAWLQNPSLLGSRTLRDIATGPTLIMEVGDQGAVGIAHH